jgi:hypothetical protein
MAWINKPTIEDEGGIAAHVTNMGLDWALFETLDDKGYPNTWIGKELRPDSPLDGRTIGKWRKLRKEAGHDTSKTD